MTTASRWDNYANLKTIVKDGEAKSIRHIAEGLLVVRPTTDGRFAVLHVICSRARILIVVPNLDRARAYSATVARNN